jgi:hypothetical protein
MSSDVKDMLVLVWYNIKMPLFKTLLIVFTFLSLPNKNFFTLALTVLVYSYGFDLFTRKPKFSRWLKNFATTSSVFLVMAAIYFFFGLFGLGSTILAGLVVLVLWVVYLLWVQWDTYDAVTSWGADRITGKTKENFDLEKVIKDAKDKKD